MPTLEIVMLLVGAAFCAGFVDAIAGGGGLITIPALLAAGVPPAQSLATSKLQASFGTFMATSVYWRAGQIDVAAMAVPVACTFVGAALGAAAVQMVDPSFLEAVVPVLLVAIALYFLLSPRAGDLPARQRISLGAFGASVGFGVGFYDGFFGPGAGSFYAIGCVALLGQPLRQATANTKLLNFTSNVVSLGVFALGGKIIWALGLAMAVGQLAGSYLGSKAALRFGASVVRPLLVAVCLAMTVRLVTMPDNALRLAVLSLLD
ncbi:MAG TPA: TSUP family transporter [Azospirillaceae bacterium]|nr:TSUP family transporter [Azospirillaceae bacterium]